MNKMKNNTVRLAAIIIFVLLSVPAPTVQAADQFSISPIYVQDFMRNNAGKEYKFHAPGFNVSFIRDGSLDLIFSITAGIPVWLTEDGSSHISFDYYTYPASFQFLTGPAWFFPMGKSLVFEPSLGLQTGFINMKGTGYSSLQFAPLGIGTDLRLKMMITPRLILGLMAGFNWNIIDLQHFSDHDTGYSIVAGISAGFKYESGRIEKKRGRRE